MIEKSLVVKHIDENGMTTYLTLSYGIIFDFFYENDPLSITIYIGNPADTKIGFLINTTLDIEPFNPFAQIFLEKTEHGFGEKAEECAQNQFCLKIEEVLSTQDRIFDLPSFLEELSGALNDCADTYVNENFHIIPDEICDKMTEWEGKTIPAGNIDSDSDSKHEASQSSNT